jgi:hypothetical protein
METPSRHGSTALAARRTPLSSDVVSMLRAQELGAWRSLPQLLGSPRSWRYWLLLRWCQPWTVADCR